MTRVLIVVGLVNANVWVVGRPGSSWFWVWIAMAVYGLCVDGAAPWKKKAQDG